MRAPPRVPGAPDRLTLAMNASLRGGMLIRDHQGCLAPASRSPAPLSRWGGASVVLVPVPDQDAVGVTEFDAGEATDLPMSLTALMVNVCATAVSPVTTIGVVRSVVEVNTGPALDVIS